MIGIQNFNSQNNSENKGKWSFTYSEGTNGTLDPTITKLGRPRWDIGDGFKYTQGRIAIQTYNTIPYDSVFNSTTLSVSGWFMITDNTKAEYPIYQKAFTSHTPPYYQTRLNYRGSGTGSNPNHINFSVNVGGALKTASYEFVGGITENKWHHIAGTYDGTDVKLYLDNILVDTLTFAGTPTGYTTDVTLMSMTNVAVAFDGGICNVAYFDDALTETELSNVYYEGRIRTDYSNIPHIVSHWKMDSIDGKDFMNNHNGTTTNIREEDIINVAGALPITGDGIGATPLLDGPKKVEVWVDKLENITSISMPDDLLSGHIDFTGFDNCTNWTFNGVGNSEINQITFPTTDTPPISINWGSTSNGVSQITTLDLSTFSNLSGSLDFENHDFLTTLILPTSNPNGAITLMNFTGCDVLTSGIDLSGLKFSTGPIYFNNTLISSISLPIDANISGTINLLYLQSSNLSGSIDLSVMGTNKLEGDIRLNSNSGITEFIFPSTNLSINRFQLHTCDITGTLDISGLTNLSGHFNIGTNPNLNSITYPTLNSNAFTIFDIQNCNLSGTFGFASTFDGEIDDFYLQNNNFSSIVFNNITNDIAGARCGNNNITTLDFSPLEQLGGTIGFNDMATLTSVTFPTSSNRVVLFVSGWSSGLTTIDLSGFNNFNAQINLYLNPSLTSITLPTTSTSAGLKRFRIEGSGLTTLNFNSLDWVTNGDGTSLLWVQNSSSLTTITLPTAITGSITQFKMHSCNLTGAFDISVLGTDSLGKVSGLNQGLLELQGNQLTSITFPSSSNELVTFNVASNQLTSLDFSMLTNVRSTVAFQSNVNLTSVTLPTFSGAITVFYMNNTSLTTLDMTKFVDNSDGIAMQLQDCGMSAGEVNLILIDIEAKGWINGTLNISGTNNAPDGTSGGYNGTAGVSSLIASGWTVTTT